MPNKNGNIFYAEIYFTCLGMVQFGNIEHTCELKSMFFMVRTIDWGNEPHYEACCASSVCVVFDKVSDASAQSKLK